jgi:hypothetical protein
MGDTSIYLGDLPNENENVFNVSLISEVKKLSKNDSSIEAPLAIERNSPAKERQNKKRLLDNENSDNAECGNISAQDLFDSLSKRIDSLEKELDAKAYLEELVFELEEKVKFLETKLAAASAVEDKVNKVDEQIVQIKDNLGAALTHAWSGVVANTSPASRSSAPIPEKQVEVVNTVLSEQRERERRANNVIIFNINELVSSSNEQQTKHDESSVLNLLTKINIDTSKVKFIRRFNKNPNNNNNNNKPAPILVRLESPEIKGKVLFNAKNLINMNEFKGIFINPDLTPAERVLGKQMREERNRLNQIETRNNSEYRWRIRGGKFSKYRINVDQYIHNV